MKNHSYDFQDDEEIIYYVYNLNWHLPKETQLESMEKLTHLPPGKVELIIPKYGKQCWENGVAVIKRIGYPKNKKALPRLARLLQDRNWPGALDAIELFRSLGTEISVLYIEKECEEAINDNEADWLEHLFFACNSLKLNSSDFNKMETYNLMKKLAESLD